MRFFETLAKLAGPLDGPSKVDDQIDRHITAAIDGGIDMLLAADGHTLAEQSREAKSIHDTLIGQADAGFENHQMYIAGRIGSLVEVLGLASERCAPSGFDTLLRSERFKPLLDLLARGPVRNVDLSRALGESEESVCRKLRELRGAGATGTTKRGREVFNTLLPAARSIVSAPPEPDAFDMTALPGLATPSRCISDERGRSTAIPRLDLVAPDMRAQADPSMAEAA